MKWAGRIVHVFLVMASLTCLAPAAYGNMVAPPDAMAVPHVDQDGIPYTGYPGYMLECYGHSEKNLSRTEYLPDVTRAGSRSLQMVYSVNHGRTLSGVTGTAAGNPAG